MIEFHNLFKFALVTIDFFKYNIICRIIKLKNLLFIILFKQGFLRYCRYNILNFKVKRIIYGILLGQNNNFISILFYLKKL